MRSYLMQDEYGQVEEAQSISAGLDYPGVGPEHAYLRVDRPGRVPGGHRRRGARRVPLLARTEGIIPALEPAHALAWVVREAAALAGADGAGQPVGPRRQGRRPGDGRSLAATTARPRVTTFRAAARRDGRKLLVPYITGGYPGWEDAVRAAAAAGADAIEIGIPFSDPVMDGPVIQQASQAALDAGRHAAGDPRRGRRASTSAIPLAVMTYYNLVHHDGHAASPAGSSPPASPAASCPTCRSRSPGRGARPPTTPASRR